MSAAVRRLRAAPAPPAGPEPAGDDPRLSRGSAATAAVLQLLRDHLDRDDVTSLVGLLLLAVGLWVWAGLGPALTVTGLLVLAYGIASTYQSSVAKSPGSGGGG